MFLDKVKIFIKAGDGGDGIVSFHRAKYVPNGGPDGGDGGNGGSVIFEADNNSSTLINFKYKRHYRAEKGVNGEPSNRTGRCGEDIIIKVPCGTVIRDVATGKIIADMFNEGDRVVALEGGKGGKGNSRFKSATRKAPAFSQFGERLEEREIILELKTIADVGLVGFPNVGKSTLLSIISAARPKIANYHFTTLIPNLGVVKAYEDAFVVADIPGLIEGASEGQGLGHEFLKHIERVRLIVHIVDISSSEDRDPVQDYYTINKELESYSEILSNLPQIVVANKCDLVNDNKVFDRFEKETGIKLLRISAISNDGVEELVNTIYKRLSKIEKPKPIEYEPFEVPEKNYNDFEIIREDENTYVVVGGLVDKLIMNVVLSDYQSFNYFQKTLKDKGVIKALYKKGAKQGDTVRVSDIEFELVD